MRVPRSVNIICVIVGLSTLLVLYLGERSKRIRLEKDLLRRNAVAYSANTAAPVQASVPLRPQPQKIAGTELQAVAPPHPVQDNRPRVQRQHDAEAAFAERFKAWRIQNEIEEIESMTVLSSEQKLQLEEHFKREMNGENVAGGLVTILGEKLANEVELERTRRFEADLAEQVETESIRLGRKLNLGKDQEAKVSAALTGIFRDTRRSFRELFRSQQSHPDPGERREQFDELRKMHNERVQEILQPLLSEAQYNLLLQDQAERSQRGGPGRFYR